jgi:hypothetical protein
MSLCVNNTDLLDNHVHDYVDEGREFTHRLEENVSSDAQVASVSAAVAGEKKWHSEI